MEPPPDSTVDPVAILGLMRSFINAVASGDLPPQGVVWDEGNDLLQASALEGPAAVLFDAGGPGMLAAVATSAAAAGTWRGAEVAVGVLANMACHASLRAQLLQDTELVEFATGLALPSEDAWTAGEACRLCSTMLAGSTGAYPWYEALSSPDALKALAWIVGNSTNPSVVARALGAAAALLGAAPEPPPALAERLVELSMVPLALSAIRSRLHELEEGADEGWQTRWRAPSHRPASPALAAAASEEVLREAMAVLYQLGGTKSGAEALGREADAAAATVRLAAAEGPESDAAAPSIFLLAQIEDRGLEKLLVEEPGAVHVVLAALSGTCPATADAADALPAAALHLLALILRHLNAAPDAEFEGLQGVAAAVAGTVLPNDDSPTAKYCTKAIESLNGRLH